MSDFEVRWPKPNLAYCWMVKNGLFPKKTAMKLYSPNLPNSCDLYTNNDSAASSMTYSPSLCGPNLPNYIDI
jgi:hypothetical protein